MKPQFFQRSSCAFTLVEVMMSVSCALLILAAVLTAGVALQRSFMAVESYSISEGDQLRVQDYIALDCRRAVDADVDTTTNKLTVLVPAYFDASGNALSPSYSGTGTPTYSGRIVQDGVTTLGSNIITSATASFSSADVGKILYNSNFTTGTTITGVSSSTTATLSNSATASTTTQAFGIGTTIAIAYYQSGSSFIRQVGSNSSTCTTGQAWLNCSKVIATNVNNFTVSPLDLTNNVSCSITFAPAFTIAAAVTGTPGVTPTPASVAGTTVYANTFLRNARSRKNNS